MEDEEIMYSLSSCSFFNEKTEKQHPTIKKHIYIYIKPQKADFTNGLSTDRCGALCELSPLA